MIRRGLVEGRGPFSRYIKSSTQNYAPIYLIQVSSCSASTSTFLPSHFSSSPSNTSSTISSSVSLFPSHFPSCSTASSSISSSTTSHFSTIFSCSSPSSTPYSSPYSSSSFPSNFPSWITSPSPSPSPSPTSSHHVPISQSHTHTRPISRSPCHQCSILHKSTSLGPPHSRRDITLRRFSTHSGGDQRQGSAMSRAHQYVVPYCPPSWAAELRGAPHEKLNLATLPTPIHRWHLPGVPDGFEVYIKRDDMTGSTLSGNKVRKLEFLLADAVRQGCEHVITCGGLQSNHCRTTAMAATQLGLHSHLLLCTHITRAEDIDGTGNVLLDQLSGAKLYLVPTRSPLTSHLAPRMEALSTSIREKTGEKSYQIPVGGSDNVGIWGYMEGFSELLDQGLTDRFDDVTFACGSGGTAEGLALGNYLSKSGMRIHGFAVSDDSQYFHQHLEEALQHFGLEGQTTAEAMLDIVDDVKGRGYGLSTHEELAFAVDVMRTTGITLDPVYTGKAVMALVRELNHNPQRFRGKRILFIHTGGVYGMYDGRLGEALQKDTAAVANIHTWANVSDPCPF